MNATVDKSAQTQVPIHPLIAERWSPRAFQDQPVEQTKILALLEAARWAPSSRNLQPWQFIVTARPESGYERLWSCLGENNQRWAKSAPVLLLVIAETEFDGRPNRFAWYDTGQAVANLSIQATAEGLSLRQMGGFDREKAAAVFQLPATSEPVCVLAIGYRADLSLLPEDLRERELTPRARKPLSTFVFSRLWGHVAGILSSR